MDGTSTEKFVCLTCRVVAKRRYSHQGQPRCQSCGQLMKAVGSRLAAPKRRDTKGWAQVARLVRDRALRGLSAEARQRLERGDMFKKV